MTVHANSTKRSTMAHRLGRILTLKSKLGLTYKGYWT